MQIIRRGNLHRERSFSVECPSCTCLFRFVQAEATRHLPGQLQVACPDENCQQQFLYTLKLHESQGVL